jgi:hypothetical protein
VWIVEKVPYFMRVTVFYYIFHLNCIKNPKSKQLLINYIDETWIDENTRVARGWYPKKCDHFKDMAPFTYGTEKLGKGPRLVVLSAVLESGIIPSSVLVYKVSKSKTTLDYHDNVNAETFGKWYKELLDYLDSTGKKYISNMNVTL